MVALLGLRSARISIAVLAVVSLLLGFLIFNHHTAENPITQRLQSGIKEIHLPSYLPGGKKNETPAPKEKGSGPGRESDAPRVHALASNETLGFSKILAIHMDHRWDKWDTTVLQAYTSGLNVEYYHAVDGKTEIEDGPTGKVGMPPNSGKRLGIGMMACYRSHANIWAEMVRTRSAPVLIIESDAAWDVNLRGIIGRANKELHEYLAEAKSKPADSPFYHASKQERPKDRPVEYDPEDPWQSEHWDVLALGHCHEEPEVWDPENMPAPRHYQDDFALPAGTKNRKVYRSKGWSCTTGYAVTHRGAAKLLLRLAYDFSEPVDEVMKGMMNAGELISIAVSHSPIVQWDYHANIGMNPGASSDLERIDWAKNDNEYKDDGSGWDGIRKAHSAWVTSHKFSYVKFKQPALQEAWKIIMGGEAQFTMPEIPGIGKVEQMPEPKKEEPKKEEPAAVGGGDEKPAAARRRWNRYT